MDIFKATSDAEQSGVTTWEAGFEKRPLKMNDQHVQVELIEDELTIFDLRTSELHILNPTGAAIWCLCDGENSIEMLAKHMSSTLDREYSQVYDDVEHLIRELHQRDLIILL